MKTITFINEPELLSLKDLEYIIGGTDNNCDCHCTVKLGSKCGTLCKDKTSECKMNFVNS